MQKEEREAIQTIKTISGDRAFYSSRACKIPNHGIAEFTRKAERWRKWHTSLVCTWWFFCFLIPIDIKLACRVYSTIVLNSEVDHSNDGCKHVEITWICDYQSRTQHFFVVKKDFYVTRCGPR